MCYVINIISIISMDDEDLYGDLPQFDYKANLEKLQECNNQLKESKKQLTALAEELEKVKNEKEALNEEIECLKKNYSSVVKTARIEIQRKDLRIAELSKEVNFLKTRFRIPRNVIREATDSKSRKTEHIGQRRRRSRGRSEEKKEFTSSRKHIDPCETRKRDAEERRNARRSSPNKKVDEKESFNYDIKTNSSLYQTVNETAEEFPSISVSPPGNDSVSVLPNISDENTNKNDTNEVSRALQAPNVSLPTLYSQRMFRKLYNLDSPKTDIETSSPKLSSTDGTDSAIPDAAVTENPQISLESAVKDVNISMESAVKVNTPILSKSADDNKNTFSTELSVKEAESVDNGARLIVTESLVKEDLPITTKLDVLEDIPIKTKSAVLENIPIETESAVKVDLPVISEPVGATTTVSTCSVKTTCAPTIESIQGIISNNILTSKSKCSFDNMKPISNLVSSSNGAIRGSNIGNDSSLKINNGGNIKSDDSPKEVTNTIESDQTLKYPEETKRSMSLEEELHLSSDSRLDGTSTNIVDIHLNIQSNIMNSNSERGLQVEELKNILSNLNKLNNSKRIEELNSVKENDGKLDQNLLNPLENAIPKKPEVPTINEPPLQSQDCKTSNKFCSTTLGLRLMNRQTKTLVKPISNQWSENCKKNFDKDCSMKNKNENFLTIPKTPPRSEDKENDNQDIVEALFGSPLKWTENSVDDVPSKLCPPPSAFEDSCSAQIENAKFKKLNNTESVSSTKTVKEIIVSKNDKDVSTMTIESRISVQKIKEVPRRPFEQLNNEKKGKSNFSAYLQNTDPMDANSSITLTTLSGSVKSLRKSPICSKYHDSILGTFDDTTQLISALAQEHSKVSPITTPVKDNKTVSPESKMETTIPSPIPAQSSKIASPLSSFKNKVFPTPSPAKITDKKTIFLEEPINILCPRRKAREDPKKKVPPRNASKNEKEFAKNKEQSNENQATSSPSIHSQERITRPSYSKELNVGEKIVTNPQEASKSLISDLSPRITTDKCNINPKISTPSDKCVSSSSRRHCESQRESRRPSCENKESFRRLTEKSKRQLSSEKHDDRGLKRRLSSGEKVENETKRHSSEKYDNVSKRYSSEKYPNESRRRSSEKYDADSRRRSSEKYDADSRRRSSEKYDADSRRRKSHSYRSESNSRANYDRHEDRDSRRRSSHDKGSNSSRQSSSDRHDDNRHRDKGESECSPFERHNTYRHYYDENGRKKVSFTTISTKVSSKIKESLSSKKLNPPKEIIGQNKSATPPKTTFKRPLSYERIRRSNCLFRETSVERRIWRTVRHRIRRTPVNIIKRRDFDQGINETKVPQKPKEKDTPSPSHNVRVPHILSPDNGCSKPPVRIVRTSKKIDWSASPIQVVSTNSTEDPNKPRTESLMKWVLQPIDFPLDKNIQGQKENNSKNDVDMSVVSTVVSSTPNKTSVNKTTPKQISSAVRISRNRPVKFGVSEISAQLCKTSKDA